jgi:hypothetical protein
MGDLPHSGDPVEVRVVLPDDNWPACRRAIDFGSNGYLVLPVTRSLAPGQLAETVV